MSALAFRGVTVALDGRTVLSGVDLDIRQGEFVGMLGSNGSGKTTLMRAALGLIPVQSGAIRVLGRPAARGNPDVGYMPQMRGNIARLRLTGWDLVASAAGGGRWGLPRLDAGERRDVAEAIEIVGASELARRPVSEMSGGERQRLLLSQALIGRPKLMFLDEPLVSLDPTHQRSVVEIAKRLSAELGITVVFSAHELNPLLNAIDRVLYLGNGNAVLGTVDEVITGPVLSRLYGSEIEVLRLNGRVFVMAGDVEIEREEHRHEHGHHHHHHPDQASEKSPHAEL